MVSGQRGDKEIGHRDIKGEQSEAGDLVQDVETLDHKAERPHANS